MRTLSLAASLIAALAALPAAAAEDGPTKIQLEVGQEAPLGGFRPICDDPSIATISAEGKGILKGLKAGTTTCSVSIGSPMGQRRIYQVIVIPPPPKGPGGKGPGGEGGRP